MTERFSEVAERNCIKKEENVVKLFFRNKFVLEFRKVASISPQRPPTNGPLPKKGLKFVVLPLEI